MRAPRRIRAENTPGSSPRRRHAALAIIACLTLLASACGTSATVGEADSAASPEATRTPTPAFLAPTPTPGQDAGASNADEIAATCSLVYDATYLGDGSLPALAAAQQLQARSAPNPPGIDLALDTIIALEQGSTPPGSYAEAIETLVGYYGGFCPLLNESDFGLETEGNIECAAGEGPGAREWTVTNIPANDPDGGLVGHDGPGVEFAETWIFAPNTSVESDGRCVILPSGARWWYVIESPGVEGWVNSRYLGLPGAATGSAAPAPADDELGISCYYKFDEQACAAYPFDNPAVQGPTNLLEAGCRESPSRRTLECAELAVRGVTIDAAHGALGLEIIQAAGLRCEQGVGSFSNPNLHSLACEYGQISPN